MEFALGSRLMVVMPEADQPPAETTDFGSVYSGSAPEAHPPSAENHTMLYAYVPKSITYGTRYVGSAENVTIRLAAHNAGKVRYTKGRKPWKLIYQEQFYTRSEAVKREKFLKTGQGRKYLDSILTRENS